MHNRPVGIILRAVLLAIFALIALRDWISWAKDTFSRCITSCATVLGLSSGGTASTPPRRGKQPKAPRVLAVILAEDSSGAASVQKLADLLKW